MKVLIFEDNLIWSTRLVRTLRGLGHEAEVHSPLPPAPSPFAGTSHPENGEGEVRAAIVNLASPGIADLVAELRADGIYVIGHAGHKEKELHALGKDAGCDRLATNSEITWKLGEILGSIER